MRTIVSDDPLTWFPISEMTFENACMHMVLVQAVKDLKKNKEFILSLLKLLPLEAKTEQHSKSAEQEKESADNPHILYTFARECREFEKGKKYGETLRAEWEKQMREADNIKK